MPHLQPDSMPMRGGCLLQFAGQWAQSTSDAWVLQNSFQGVRLGVPSLTPQTILAAASSYRLCKTPVETPGPESGSETPGSETSDTDTCNRACTSITKEQGSLFCIIHLAKRKGDMRAILDLKWLNRFLKKWKFKIETWRSIVAALEQGTFKLQWTFPKPTSMSPF